jgi:uncharacterized membrane protein
MVDKGSTPVALHQASLQLADEPVLAVYERKEPREMNSGVLSSGIIGVILALIAIAFAAFRHAVPALVFGGLAVGMVFLFRMSQRMRDNNARLSYNRSQLIAETPDRTVVHDLKQLRVINQVKGQDHESNFCIFNIEFKDGTVYWLHGEDDVNVFVTELRRISGARII